MIVTCPACQTRYLVDETELGGEAGRRVRCASCGHLWRFFAEEAVIQMAVAEAAAEVEAAAQAANPAPATPFVPASAYAPGTAATAPPAAGLRAEPGSQALPRPIQPAAPRPPPVPVALPTRPPISLRSRISALVVLVFGIVLIAVLARDRITTQFPQAAELYATLGLIELPGAGLEISAAMTRNPETLIVEGTINNPGGVTRRVGRLRITLRDGARSVLDTRVLDPPVPELPAGARAPHYTVFEHPSITVAAADVAFSEE
jgi:predicted Zn finger-like uncharacterized protein